MTPLSVSAIRSTNIRENEVIQVWDHRERHVFLLLFVMSSSTTPLRVGCFA